MPEAGRSHEEEGWDVRAGAGLGLAAALYGLAFLGVAVAAAMFGLYFHAHPARPIPEVYPAPQLNGRIDSEPTWSFAPRQQAPDGIDQAMRSLADKGAAGWGGDGAATGRGGGRRR
jgi:hypothetical protein